MGYSEIANMMVLLLTLLAGGVVASLRWWMKLDAARLDDGCQLKVWRGGDSSRAYRNGLQLQKCCSLATRGASIGMDSLPCLVRVRAGNLLPDSLE